MFDVSSEESTLRVSTNSGETVSLTLDATAPKSVRLEIATTCGCSEVPGRRVGSYTDTDFGIR
ncbi:hypothetical protein [Arthrobacter sp. NtRootA1]|jgi:hypothetical protein|uniref:hypothetical protein n=1 Tax=Micrococcaceae TaxID=1268 RepID=UPI001CC63439|nr:hypothetical protein [Arthrobacter sp. NtRootA1]BCW04260.1 hypothetical protein NtRootA1_03980 [Arthrobacter sp. NtRootA1]